MRWMLSTLLGLWCMTVNAEPVAWDGPGAGGWDTRSSQHFMVHYPRQGGYDELSVRVLEEAEQAHSELTPFFGSAPELKTHLVISDDHDIANGWATFFPFPQIRLYLTPPYDLSGLQNFDDWLSLLIRHEYVHVLHMELSRGLPEDGQKILGRFPLFFPHSLTSPMLLEGLAVYLETDYQQGTGRLASSWYQMQMREEVRSDQFASLGEAAIASRDWPYGQYYLYGAFFTEYLMQTYGEDAFARWLTHYSSRILPWVQQDSSARLAFGKDFEALWREFRLAMYARFGAPETTPASESAEATQFSAPAIETDGAVRLQVVDATDQGLVYLARNDEDRPVIRTCDAELSCRDLLTPTLGSYTQLALSAAGDPALVRLTLTASGRVTSDVLVYEDEKAVRWTQGMRVAQADWLPGEQGLVFSRYAEGRASFFRAAEPGEQELLWSGEYGDLIGEFSVAPDGKSLVASRKRPGAGWNLESFDLNSRSWTPLTSHIATESGPVFTAQGDLLYVADYDGTYNVYRLTDAGAQRLTDSARGAFAPALVGDTLLYQEYQAEGFVFRSVPVKNPAMAEKGNLISVVSPEPAPLWDTLPPQTEVSDAVAYEPWSTLRPYYWLPVMEFNGSSSWVGASTSGTDALQRHAYGVTAMYDLQDNLLATNLYYRYQRWLALLDVDYSKIDSVPGNDDLSILRDDTLLLQRNYLFSAFEDSLGIHAGLVHQQTEITHLEDDVELIGPSAYSRDSIGLAATLSLNAGLLQSPGVGYGSYTELVAENYDLLSGDASGDHLQFGWRYTVDLPGRQGLTLALSGGYASEDAPLWRLGGLPPQEDYALFGRDQLSLRGYGAGVQYGRYYERERLTWRGELSRFEDNWDILPLGVDNLEMALFLERGRAWSDESDPSALLGAAAELRLNLILGYRVRAPLVIGIASPLGDEAGEDEVYGGLYFTF